MRDFTDGLEYEQKFRYYRMLATLDSEKVLRPLLVVRGFPVLSKNVSAVTRKVALIYLYLCLRQPGKGPTNAVYFTVLVPRKIISYLPICITLDLLITCG
jgi:hypothetical protein